jgi:pimeloyl-ACP methyl ester carboxylesterase
MGAASTPAYSTGTVVSADGTTIGYRRLGAGPGVILVHGAMQAAQNFMALAAALADGFTVYVPDRRGRGLSGPHGERYGLDREAEDIQALVAATGTEYLFGLSAGAIVALHATLTTPAIRRAALYEPPLPVPGATPDAWAPRYRREVADGKLAAAMVTVMKGTADGAIVAVVPRWMLVPLMAQAIAAQARVVRGDEVPLRALIPTVGYDTQLVAEARGNLERYRALQAEVLLLGGSRSRGYLKAALAALGAILPRAERVELPGVGHLAADNDGQPARVGRELRRFFTGEGS